MISVSIDKILPFDELDKRAKEIANKAKGEDFYIFTRDNKPVVALVDVNYLLKLTENSAKKNEQKNNYISDDDIPEIKPMFPNSQKANSPLKPITPSIKPASAIPPVNTQNPNPIPQNQINNPPTVTPAKPPVNTVPPQPFTPFAMPNKTVNSTPTPQTPPTPPPTTNQTTPPVSPNSVKPGPTPIPPSNTASVLSAMGITTAPQTLSDDSEPAINPNAPDDTKSPAQYSGANDDANVPKAEANNTGMRLLDLNNANPSATSTNTLNTTQPTATPATPTPPVVTPNIDPNLTTKNKAGEPPKDLSI